MEDYLGLKDNENIRKMLAKNGHVNEEVLMSDSVVKINKRGKEQKRIMLVTNLAMYNVTSMTRISGYVCRRRIKLESIRSISVSQCSNEFVVHVPEEYDYRFKSHKKIEISRKLCEIVLEHCETPLKCVLTEKNDLKQVMLTKKAARLESRDDRRKRLSEFLAKRHESDE
eukprot:815315_1